MDISVTETGTTQNETLMFQPRLSNGRAWTGGLGFLFAGIFLGPLVPVITEVSTTIIIVFLVLASLTGGPLLVMAYFYPAMHYLVTDEHLILRYGPIMTQKIPIEKIQKLQRRNLQMSWTINFRFPGLALYECDYLDVRRVYMCSTSATTDILLIDDGRVLYGITPEDEDGLISALQERSEQEIEIVEPYIPMSIGR